MALRIWVAGLRESAAAGAGGGAIGGAAGACWAAPAGLAPGAVGAAAGFGAGGWLRGARALALDVGQDVLARDASGVAGARHLGEVELVLARQPAHGGRDAALVVGGRS